MREQNEAFDKLLQDLLEGYWRLNPVAATHAGVHRYDGTLPNWSALGLVEHMAWRGSHQAALQAFKDEELAAGQKLDKKVALAELTYREILEQWRWVERAPAFYVEEALNGLNYLLARPDEAAPLEEQEHNLLSRLGAIAGLLEQGRANIKAELVPPEFIEIGKVAVRGALGFIEGLTLPDKPESEEARQSALVALAEYRQFIENDLRPEGHFATGSELFERILREQHGLNLTPGQLYELGEQTANDLQDRLTQLARQIDPGQSWQVIVESLKAEHPTREGLLQAYRDEAARARDFALAKNLVTIPAGEVLEIRPTAPFLRATMPLGHFDKTPPFAEKDNLGILYITPIDPALPASRQEELLAAHCNTAIRAICLHETYPGHHLQLWWAKLKASPVRKQFASTLYAEGWALYCEEMLEEAGFFDTPALSLWQLKNSMWRAVRMMIDVGLHSGKLTLEAAAQLLVERAGLEPNTARGVVLRYTTSPTQPSSYMLGRNRIVELRRQSEARLGGQFNLLDFHSKLLDYSSVSPAFIPDGLVAG
jgi:uncharacterized protein (DUF885 family)